MSIWIITKTMREQERFCLPTPCSHVFSLVYPTFPTVCAPHMRFGLHDHFALTTIPSSCSASSCLSLPTKCFNINICKSSIPFPSIFSIFISLNRCYQAHTHTHPLPYSIPLFTMISLCWTAIKSYKGQSLALLTQYWYFHHVHMITISFPTLISKMPNLLGDTWDSLDHLKLTWGCSRLLETTWECLGIFLDLCQVV